MSREPNQHNPTNPAPENGAFSSFRVNPETIDAIQRARETNPDDVARNLSLEHLKATARRAAIKDMDEAHRLAEMNANLLERRLNAMTSLKRPGRTIRVASTFVDRSTGFMADVFIHENSEPGSPWAADSRAARSELLRLFEVVEEQAPNFFLSPPTALRGTHQGTQAADRRLWTISRNDKGALETEGFGIIDHSDLQPDVKEGHHHDRTAEELEKRTDEDSRLFLESGARLEAALSRHEGKRLSGRQLRALAHGDELTIEEDAAEVPAMGNPDNNDPRIPRESEVSPEELRKHSERLMRENFGDDTGQRAEAREPEWSLEERPLEDRVADVRDEQWSRAALEAERGGPETQDPEAREPDAPEHAPASRDSQSPAGKYSWLFGDRRADTPSPGSTTRPEAKGLEPGRHKGPDIGIGGF